MLSGRSMEEMKRMYQEPKVKQHIDDVFEVLNKRGLLKNNKQPEKTNDHIYNDPDKKSRIYRIRDAFYYKNGKGLQTFLSVSSEETDEALKHLETLGLLSFNRNKKKVVSSLTLEFQTEKTASKLTFHRSTGDTEIQNTRKSASADPSAPELSSEEETETHKDPMADVESPQPKQPSESKDTSKSESMKTAQSKSPEPAVGDTLPFSTGLAEEPKTKTSDFWDANRKAIADKIATDKKRVKLIRRSKTGNMKINEEVISKIQDDDEQAKMRAILQKDVAINPEVTKAKGKRVKVKIDDVKQVSGITKEKVTEAESLYKQYLAGTKKKPTIPYERFDPKEAMKEFKKWRYNHL